MKDTYKKQLGPEGTKIIQKMKQRREARLNLPLKNDLTGIPVIFISLFVNFTIYPFTLWFHEMGHVVMSWLLFHPGSISYVGFGGGMMSFPSSRWGLINDIISTSGELFGGFLVLLVILLLVYRGHMFMQWFFWPFWILMLNPFSSPDDWIGIGQMGRLIYPLIYYTMNICALTAIAYVYKKHRLSRFRDIQIVI